MIARRCGADAAPVGGHGYGPDLVCLYLRLVLVAGVSLRGASRVLATVGQALGPLGLPIPVPHWTTGRLWLLRLGHAALTTALARADDWAWLIDHSVQIGQAKCLVILGVRLCDLPARGQCLRHGDLHLVALMPASHWSRADVDRALEEAAGRTGVPRAIVDDHGVDLNGGVALFQRRHPDTVEIYDAKHKAACLLKGRLARDARWQAFQAHVAQTRCAVQQTELAFLTPPAPRPKARFMNLGPQLAWARRVPAVLGRAAAPAEAAAAALELGAAAESEAAAEAAESEPDVAATATAPARRPVTAERLAEKLGWIEGFADDVACWSRLQRAADVAVALVNRQGIYRGVARELAGQLRQQLDADAPPGDADATRLAAELVRFVRSQESKAKPGERFPGSTEVLESCFGKFKQLEKQQSRGGFTQLLLGFGAMLARLTTDTVREAMEASRTADVRAWAARTLGVTLFAQRKQAFASAIKSG